MRGCSSPRKTCELQIGRFGFYASEPCGFINLKNSFFPGTVEFLVDDNTGDFFFLEMNTRLQVEHGVTEMIFSGLDIVELMILQGMAEHSSGHLEPYNLRQEGFSAPTTGVHAIEARVYCENPVQKFAPSPGVLQYVKFPDEGTNELRIDTWVRNILELFLITISDSQPSTCIRYRLEQ